MTTRDDIHKIRQALQCACESNAATIEAINKLTDVTELLYTTTLYANWTTIVGNSVDYTYDTNNNVILAEYYEGATLIFTQTYNYVGNNCTNITTT
jgi:hypothetical protein